MRVLRSFLLWVSLIALVGVLYAGLTRDAELALGCAVTFMVAAGLFTVTAP